MHTLLSVCSLAAASPVSVRTVDHGGGTFHVATLDLTALRLDLVGQRDDTLRDFSSVRAATPELVASTNAGIFHSPERPVGVWIEDGVELEALEPRDGRGNFFLKPNGVFWIDGAGAHVADAAGWSAPPSTRIATQSGPALVIGGAVHPAFDPQSGNLKLRSGVGVSDPWTVHLVVSDGPSTFHDLATLFRDSLGCDSALYLDGTISGLDAPGLPAPPDAQYAGMLTAVERSKATGLRDGDLVFQRSTSSQAAAISAATGSDWTHMGLVRLVDGQPMVLEATQPVKLTPYGTWVGRGVDGRVAIKRLVEAEAVWTPAALQRLDALQTQWLGRPYDARFGWGDEALYCSELVYKALSGAANIELAPLRPLGSYAVSDPSLRGQIEARWGAVPVDLLVVAPSDLFDARGLVDVVQ